MAISNCETWNEPKVWREKQEPLIPHAYMLHAHAVCL